MQFYSDPEREQDPHSLPDCETYHLLDAVEESDPPTGWYWQSCFPGCLPDGDPSGPFKTEELAIADCRDGVA